MTIQNTINTALQALTDAKVNITTCNIPITAIDPPMGTGTTPIHNPTTVCHIPALRDQSNTDAQLTLILERMCAYFFGRVDATDIQALSFCLRHLFCSTAKLYQNILPNLTNTMIQARQSKDMLTTYCIWDQLQAIDGHFKRLESLCHLLTSTIPPMLDTLEYTCRAQTSLIPTTCIQCSQSTQEEDNGLREVHSATTQEDALAHLNAQLRIWQQSNEQRLIFAHQFADQPTVISVPVQVDATLNILQRHTNAIFSRIVPDFLGLSANDDETATILLLDLMQKADELQFYMGTQLEPLHTLLQPQQTRHLVHTSAVFSS